MKQEPIIEIKGYGTGTYVLFGGIDISRSLLNVEYIAPGETHKPRLKLDIDIVELTKILSDLDFEHIDRFKDNMERYVGKKSKVDTDSEKIAQIFQ